MSHAAPCVLVRVRLDPRGLASHVMSADPVLAEHGKSSGDDSGDAMWELPRDERNDQENGCSALGYGSSRPVGDYTRRRSRRPSTLSVDRAGTLAGNHVPKRSRRRIAGEVFGCEHRSDGAQSRTGLRLRSRPGSARPRGATFPGCDRPHNGMSRSRIYSNVTPTDPLTGGSGGVTARRTLQPDARPRRRRSPRRVNGTTNSCCRPPMSG